MDIFNRNYGVADTVRFSLFDVNGIDEYLTALATGDCQISVDGAALANQAVTIVNGAYQISFTGTQLEAKSILVKVIDQTATKVFMDYTFTVETFGDPSAQMPIPLGSDVSTLTQMTAAIEAIETADGDTWAEVMTWLDAFVANDIDASGLRDRLDTKYRITASRTATTRTVTARDAT